VLRAATFTFSVSAPDSDTLQNQADEGLKPKKGIILNTKHKSP
jgi:hypothetical protein